jgi:hypothetical protein
MSEDLETVLVFQREHSNRLEEWVAPRNDVKMWVADGYVQVGRYVSPDTESWSSELHTYLALAHIVEAHLVTRPKPVNISD